MKVKSIEVRNHLRAIWPNTWSKLRGNVWIFDRELWLPSRENVEVFLKENQVDRMKYMPEVQDCDDQALQLYADAKRIRGIMAEYQEIPRDEWATWAFGRAMGTEFRGMRNPHSINIVVTRDDGVLLIEPRDDRMWKPKESHDKPFFIES